MTFFKIEDRVRCQTCFKYQRPGETLCILWKHSTRHYRVSYEAGRATNQQSIHHVRPWSSQFGIEEYSKDSTVIENLQRVPVTERSWSATSRTSSTECDVHEQGHTHSDMEEFDITAIGTGFTSLLLTTTGHHRDQYKVVRPYQGGQTQHHKNTQYTKRLYSGKRRTWPDNPQFPMLNCDHRGLQWRGHLHRGLHSGLLRHRKRGDTITITYVWCPSIRLEHKEEHKHRATSCCDMTQIVKICFSVIILRLDGRRVTVRTEVCTETRSHAHFFSGLASRTDRWRSPYTSSLWRLKVGLKSHFIKSSDADLPYLSATVTTSTTTNWHFCTCVASAQVLVPLVWQCDVTPNKHRLRA